MASPFEKAKQNQFIKVNCRSLFPWGVCSEKLPDLISIVWSFQFAGRLQLILIWSPISDLFSKSFPSLTASSAVSLSWTPSGTLTVLRPFLVSPVCMSTWSLISTVIQDKPDFHHSRSTSWVRARQSCTGTWRGGWSGRASSRRSTGSWGRSRGSLRGESWSREVVWQLRSERDQLLRGISTRREQEKLAGSQDEGKVEA